MLTQHALYKNTSVGVYKREYAYTALPQGYDNPFAADAIIYDCVNDFHVLIKYVYIKEPLTEEFVNKIIEIYNTPESYLHIVQIGYESEEDSTIAVRGNVYLQNYNLLNKGIKQKQELLESFNSFVEYLTAGNSNKAVVLDETVYQKIIGLLKPLTLAQLQNTIKLLRLNE